MFLYSDVLERLHAVFRNTSNNKKAGTRPVSRLLVPAFLKAYCCVEWLQTGAWRALLATIPRLLSFSF
jgi:hypothetical protein